MSSFVAFRCLGPEKRAGPGYGLSQVTVETGPAGDLAPPPPTDADAQTYLQISVPQCHHEHC